MMHNRPFRMNHNGVVSFNLSPDAPCPCESGKPSRNCCLTRNGFRCKPISTTPQGSLTGYSHNECYANILGDCSKILSREHFVSKCILELLNKSDALSLQVGGFHWQPTEDLQSIPPNALTSRILCDRHNNVLSGLDSIAERLFRSFNEKGLTNSAQNNLFIFNGHDIERWLLKVICGLAASGNVRFDRKTDSTVPSEWIEILFSNKNFGEGQGLYVCRTKGFAFSGPTGILIGPVGRKGRLIGAFLKICGYELILSMDPAQNRQLLDRHVVYRPMELHTTGPKYEKSILFCWDQQADQGTIHLQIKNV